MQTVILELSSIMDLGKFVFVANALVLEAKTLTSVTKLGEAFMQGCIKCNAFAPGALKFMSEVATLRYHGKIKLALKIGNDILFRARWNNNFTQYHLILEGFQSYLGKTFNFDMFLKYPQHAMVDSIPAISLWETSRFIVYSSKSWPCLKSTDRLINVPEYVSDCTETMILKALKPYQHLVDNTSYSSNMLNSLAEIMRMFDNRVKKTVDPLMFHPTILRQMVCSPSTEINKPMYNQMDRFVLQRLKPKWGHCVSSNKLYVAYRKWVSNDERIMSSQQFRAKMKLRSPHRKNGTELIFSGFSL